MVRRTRPANTARIFARLCRCQRRSVMATRDIASSPVHFIPAAEGGYTVEVPALEGCVTEGDTFEEAEGNAREAISLYVESLVARGRHGAVGVPKEMPS